MATSTYAKALPRKMVDEAKEYQRLYREHLTTSGTLKWKSLSSGEEYTSTTGQSGLFRLLAFALRDYIISLEAPVYDKLGEITSSGTWTVPTGVNYITAFLITGGKSGYSAPWTDVLLVENMAVTPGETISCTVGAAGGDIASRTTKFGTHEIAPTTLVYNDMSHFYCAYNNVFYCPYKITDEMFPDEMLLPLDQYPIRYPTTPGASGFVGASGAYVKTGDLVIDSSTRQILHAATYAAYNGGNGYIGGNGGDGIDALDEIVWGTRPTAGVSGENYGFRGQPGTAGGTGHANGQGGDGGDGMNPSTIRHTSPVCIYFTGNGGRGGDGGNGGNGGDGAVGGDGGNALRYGGTGGEAGKEKIEYSGSADLYGFPTDHGDGNPGSGKQGAILIFTEHRETEA